MSAARARLATAFLALAPLVVVACGEREASSPATTASAGASTPTITAPVTSATNSGITSAAPVTSSSYTDGEEAFRGGRYQDAAAIFSAYVDTRPDNVWGHYMLGLSAWKSGDLGRAERAFDQALTIDPEHLKSLINSSRVLMSLGRAVEARERIELALSIDSLSAEARRLDARARYELGDVAGAIASYQRVLTSDDRDTWAMNNLGLIYIEQDQPEQALGPLARAVELRPTAPVFQNNLGIALERTGHPAAAAKAFEAALAADSTYSKAAVSLARVNARGSVTEGDTVDLSTLAQTFRLQVQMWQDSVRVPEPVSGEIKAPTDSSSAGQEQGR